MNPQALNNKLHELTEMRNRLLTEATFPAALGALCLENHLYHRSVHPVTASVENYINVVFLKQYFGVNDRAIDVQLPSDVADANCALLLLEDIVFGAVTFDRKFQDYHLIGQGRISTSSGINRYGKGSRVPKHFKVFKVWLNDALVEQVLTS
jgi:hypothetical protein